VKSKIDELLGADLRSLALLRIAAALVIILDLCQRASDLEAHYSDFGAVPRQLAIDNLSSRWFWSLHFLSGTWQVEAILFVAAGICATALLVGYKTGFATIASWAFLVSLDVRNFHVVAGGDLLLRVVLFWSMFLPWGACFSIDTGAYNNHDFPKRIISAGTVAFTIQILLLYWFSVLSKSGHEWWREGSAVYYALSIDYVVTPLGHELLKLPPAMLELATWGVLGYEILGPILLVSPYRTGPARVLGVAGFVLLHLAILSTLLIGIFPLIAIASVLFFLPSWFWDDFLPRLAAIPRRVISVRGVSAVPGRVASVAGWIKSKWAGHRRSNSEIAKLLMSSGRSYPSNFCLSTASSVIAAALTIYVILWNVGNLPYSPFQLSDRVRSVGNLLGLDQRWEMFAPFPAKDDGWYVIPARLKNGRRVDLYSGRNVDWSKPKYIALTIKNHRWRKFFEVLRQRTFLLPGYADYLCRDWNRRHSPNESVEDLEIVFMVEWTRPNFAYFAPRELKLLHYQCPSRSSH